MTEAVLTLTTADTMRFRFVRSLLWETLHALRTLDNREHQPFHTAWLDRVDAAAARRAMPVLFALNPRAGWIPDFLAPPPRTARRSLDEELAEVADYPDELVSADLQRCLDSAPTRDRHAVLTPLIADPSAARARILTELAHAWTTLAEPFWAPVRELIDADITYRSAMLAHAGLGPLLDGLHRDVTRTEDRVVVARNGPVELDLAGRGLALMPSAFVWPTVILVHDHPWPITLVYPARGIGDLWTAPRRPPAALVGVLGRTRALLLLDLDAPATTTALAARHRLSKATTSTQLTRLRDARLVVGRRVGKEVHYRRTALGDRLADLDRV